MKFLLLIPEKFIIVSYNILSVDNAQTHWRELYYHIPARIMHWHTRKRKLLRELGLWSPDVICLQVSFIWNLQFLNIFKFLLLVSKKSLRHWCVYK